MMSNNFNNLDIPYYQNDKWVNMLKRKVKNLKENIEKEEEINKRLTIKNVLILAIDDYIIFDQKNLKK